MLTVMRGSYVTWIEGSGLGIERCMKCKVSQGFSERALSNGKIRQTAMGDRRGTAIWLEEHVGGLVWAMSGYSTRAEYARAMSSKSFKTSIMNVLNSPAASTS